MSETPTIRRMKPEDLRYALHLVEAEGWNVGPLELELLLEGTPEGCLVAEEKGRAIGMVMATSYGPAAWIGNLIVEAGFRGRGTGTRLMRQAIEYLSAHGARTIRLDAESSAVPLYRRLGFVEEGRSLRFEGWGASHDVRSVEPMSARHLSEVAELDARCFGADRSRFLRRSLEASPGLAFISYRGRALDGYIMAKRLPAGAKIGPWICDPDAVDPERAAALLRAVQSALKDQPIGVGVLEDNALSVQILKTHGFRETPHSPRMRWGENAHGGEVKGCFAIGAASKG